MSRYPLTFVVNGRKRTVRVKSDQTLLDVIRHNLDLKGAKNGCNTGDCGACAVIVDGRVVNSCLMLAQQARGSKIVTIEGIGSPKKLHPLQEAFVKEGAVQCGYCIPAMVLTGRALLDRNPRPSTSEIKRAMSSVLCRCGSYAKIIKAIQAAASDDQE